jgi:diguanylate cyclase (GGDEF)-like protein
MLIPAANAPIELDITTLFVVATCITALLGLFLLSAWMQERIRALAWWGSAYLIGGFSVAIWSIEGVISPPLPAGSANALLFVACGMIWSAARLFHGRPVLWGWLFAGSIVWLMACLSPEFVRWAAARIVLSSLIISAYTFLTAAELWRERRKTLLRRWPAIFVPMLHGMVFLFPIPLASMLPADGGIVSLASGWIAVFALETMLYVVGTAFIILVLAKERSVRVLRDAASTDDLTGLLNRRAWDEELGRELSRADREGGALCVAILDLDKFKLYNDTHGHQGGDRFLKQMASAWSQTLRAGDILARYGGEEFAVAMPGTNLEHAQKMLERLRSCLPEGQTCSAGVCRWDGAESAESLTARADTALYSAKDAGRDRIVGV